LVSLRLTALFLACKTEERYYNAQQFATLVRQGPELVDDLLALEHALIEAIQFDLGVQHPCTALHGFILDARVRRRDAATHTQQCVRIPNAAQAQVLDPCVQPRPAAGLRKWRPPG